jgi:lipopolysaccharide export LptBFGC system permease protein LptF
MPEPIQRNNQIIALALFASAITIAIVAALIFVGTIPVADGARPMIAMALGVAAFADLTIAIWFFRKGQSS